MIDAPLALALASGMVAAVNPCGFAMLPAYVTFFLGADGDEPATRGETVARAVPVALAVSLGFVAFFGVVGIAVQPIRFTVLEYAPWATIVIGVVLAGMGVTMLRGRELTARLPKLDRGGRDAGLRSMFLYGISYAIASLSCTISIFMANVVSAFSRTDVVSGIAVLLTYAAGMGLVITALTVAIALARDSAVGFLRRGMRHANRVAGGLMLVMGAYVSWYGIYSLRVREDPTTAAGPAVWVDRWSAEVSGVVSDVGATRLGLYLAMAIAAMISVSVLVSARRRQG